MKIKSYFNKVILLCLPMKMLFFFFSYSLKYTGLYAIFHHVVISSNVSKFSDFLKHLLAEKCVQQLEARQISTCLNI